MAFLFARKQRNPAREDYKFSKDLFVLGVFLTRIPNSNVGPIS